MNKILFFLASFLLTIPLAYGQYTTVTYDYGKNYFNEGQPIPAEKLLMFTGQVPDDAQRVEISIISAKGKSTLYGGVWKGEAGSAFNIPMNFRLRPSTQYDFQVDYFRLISQQEKSRTEEQVLNLLYDYVDANLVLEGSELELEKDSKKMVQEMNGILHESLYNYRADGLQMEPTISESVQQKLESIDKRNLAKNLAKKDSTRQTSIQTLADEQRTAIREQLKAEMAQFFERDLLSRSESRYVDNYETEGKQGAISINVGYGGVYIAGEVSDDFTYGNAPYVGLALPLGNNAFASKFLSNTSLSLGVFTQNFKDENGNKLTGLIVNRPLYVGLDFKIFQFVHLNAGATLLERDGINTNDGTSEKQLLVRPFIGLGTRIDLSFSIPK